MLIDSTPDCVGLNLSTKTWQGSLCKTVNSYKKNLPYEVLAVAAEGGVLEKSRDELVVFHLGNVLLFQGTLPRSEGHKRAGL